MSLPVGILSVGEIKDRWFVIHSRLDARGCRDGAVAWSLYLAGLPYYYPQVERIILEGREQRRRRTQFSLFDGYIFAAGDAAEKYCRENTELVECILQEPRAGKLAEELAIVEAALKADPQLSVSAVDRPGIKVRVIRGPWRNKEGVVDRLIERKGGMVAVHLTIETMGRSVPLELDVSDLERI